MSVVDGVAVTVPESVMVGLGVSVGVLVEVAVWPGVKVGVSEGFRVREGVGVPVWMVVGGSVGLNRNTISPVMLQPASVRIIIPIGPTNLMILRIFY